MNSEKYSFYGEICGFVLSLPNKIAQLCAVCIVKSI